jgi:hypothetical protein
MAELDAHDVRVFVVNLAPAFSPNEREFAEVLSRAFPHRIQFGKFQLRWR